MRKLLIFIFLPLQIFATNYYVSNSVGNDANPGTINAPWKTLAKVNAMFSSIQPGDSILFKRGDVFYGSLTASRSGNVGNRIIIGAYGTGELPHLTGLTTVTLNNSGNGIWTAIVPSAKTTLNVVLLNGVMQRLGRWPNINTANGGYLTYERFNGAATTIIDRQLNNAINWTGADVAIRKNNFILDICKIDNHTDSTLDYTNPAGTENTYAGSEGYGYFIQNDIRTLDQPGEWFLNKANKQLSVFMGATSLGTIQVSTIDTVINLKNFTNITVQDLKVTGANFYGIFTKDGSNITVQRVVVDNCNYYGIYSWNNPNTSILYNSVSNINSNGIFARNPINTAVNLVIEGNTVNKIGQLIGMAESGDSKNQGIIAFGFNGLSIRYNNVKNCGYNGINFQGNHVIVEYNFVDSSNNVFDDGSGIYTYAGDASFPTEYVDRNVKYNTVLRSLGAYLGTAHGQSDDSRGIYLDGKTMNCNVTGNFIAHCSGSAIFLNNNVNCRIDSNVTFNCNQGLQLNRFPLNPLLRQITVKHNYFYPKNGGNNIAYWNGQLGTPTPTTIQADYRAIFTSIDSNFYRDDIAAPFDWFSHVNAYAVPDGFNDPPAVNFTNWKTFIGTDNNSAVFTGTFVPFYNPTNTVTGNLISGVWADAKGQQYTNYTLQPYSSVLLKQISAPVPAPTPETNNIYIIGIKFLIE